MNPMRTAKRTELPAIPSRVSVAVAVWLGCDWELSCATPESLVGVAVQFGVCFLLLAAVALLWWRIAAKGKSTSASVSARGSEA